MRPGLAIILTAALGVAHVAVVVFLYRAGLSDVLRFLAPGAVAACGYAMLWHGRVAKGFVASAGLGAGMAMGSFVVGMLVCLNKFGG